MSGKRQRDLYRRGWRGWRKHLMRRWRVLKPDDLAWWIVMWLIVALGLAGMYFAGTVGLYAVVFVAFVAVFVGGVVVRGVKRVVRLARLR